MITCRCLEHSRAMVYRQCMLPWMFSTSSGCQLFFPLFLKLKNTYIRCCIPNHEGIHLAASYINLFFRQMPHSLLRSQAWPPALRDWLLGPKLGITNRPKSEMKQNIISEKKNIPPPKNIPTPSIYPSRLSSNQDLCDHPGASIRRSKLNNV